MFSAALWQIASFMSTKEIVAGLLERLPDDISLQEVAREIEFMAAVRKGFDSYKREGGIDLEDARTRVSAWAKPTTK